MNVFLTDGLIVLNFKNGDSYNVGDQIDYMTIEKVIELDNNDVGLFMEYSDNEWQYVVANNKTLMCSVASFKTLEEATLDFESDLVA